MSTPAGYAQPAAQQAFEAPSTSTALVPVLRDAGPRLATPVEKPVNAHVLFYVMGYGGLALFWIGAWVTGFVGKGYEAFNILGLMFTGLGGFGVTIHTLYKPNERKVRHLLLALASLAVTAASITLVERVAREMYAAAAVGRLEPLAEALVKDPRIREIGVFNGNVLLNGFYGPEDGPGTIEGEQGERLLQDVLARDGISREEYDAYQRLLADEGVDRAQRTASTVALSPAGGQPWLLYVAPGHPLPPAHALLDDSGTYFSEPVGGAWYMVRNGRR